METRASFARDENGRAVGIVGVTRDISQRKTADAVINKQRTEYRTILDSVPLIITYVNTEGKFIRINRSGAAALGSSPKEVVGKTFHDFFAKEEADRLLTRCREVMEFKAPTRNSISRVTLPSGQRIWANTDIIPYLDENGMVIGSINVVQDISERILAEHAHRDSEERFRNMTDLLPQTVFETDEKANFTFVNRQGYETFGFSEGDVANGMNVLQTIIPEDKARAIDNISRRIKGERFIPQEYTAVRKDGSRFPVLIYANPIIRDSKYAGMRGILVDITERKQLELSLEQSIADLNKTLDDIIATMSTIVELKDPYTAGHQKRVARLAAALAEEIGLPANKVDYIRTAALIHDIGKLYVPSDIMSKPGKLSDLEYKIIRTHSESSHDILKSIDFPWPIADIAWQHHERMDGSGYPVGLKSDEILVEARILAVADVVEAMASHRPYRPALGVDQALEEISANRDKLYDSVVVDACIRLFKEKAFTLG
jgi:PAS domain S-box-containing protein/putative nucleotidyltransferase with HDIG domain